MDDPSLFYYIEDGKAKPIKDSWIYQDDGSYNINEQELAHIKEEKEVKVYPIRDKWSTDYWTGGNDWREVHKCPKCNEEFKYWNGNY